MEPLVGVASSIRLLQQVVYLGINRDQLWGNPVVMVQVTPVMQEADRMRGGVETGHPIR